MKCKRLRTEELRNEGWFIFFESLKELIEQYGADTLDIEALFSVLISFYEDADEALELIRKNVTTEQLAESDSQRDSIFRGMADTVKAASNHFDEGNRQAAKRLQVIFDHYGNLTRKQYDEETGAIHNLLQELYAYPEDIDLLGLRTWMVQLEIKNNEFKALMKLRNSTESAKTNLRMKNIRVEADRCFRDILDRLDALMLLNGEEKYAPFVNELNTMIDRQSDVVAKRKGVANQDEPSDEEMV